MTGLSKGALATGLVLLGGGIFLLPPPPAAPSEIGASLAPVAFFFGGTLIFSVLFSIKHQDHGEASILLLSVMGLIYGFYLLVGTQLSLPQNIVISGLTTFSAGLFVASWKRWQKKRREANLRRLEEMDQSGEN